MPGFLKFKVRQRIFRGRLLPGLLLLLFLSLFTTQVLADEVSSGKTDFQYEAELTAGNTSLRRVALSWEILAAMQQPGQADLRVYNADNQPVPFSVRQRHAVWMEQKASRELNFFSGDNAGHLAQLLANQQHIGNRQLKALSANNRHYLIIPTETGDGDDAPGLIALALEWKNLQQWLPRSLRVEYSNDLLKWRSVKPEHLPYVLNERGVMLEERLIRLQQPVRAKFIRLSGGQDFVALLSALQKVHGHYHKNHQQLPALNWQTVVLSPGEKPKQYRYDPPPAVTLLQWRLALPQPGYMYAGEVYSRRPLAAQSAQQKTKPAWRYVRRFRQYHLQTAAGEVRSPVEPAGQLFDREWMLAFDQPLTNDSEQPSLEVAWQPLDVYFIAQGKGPFRLAYGSRSAKAVPALQLDEKLMAGAEEIAIAQVVKLRESVEAPAEQPVNGLAWLLWGVLGTSVVFLLWMAKRLWREMSGKQDVETN